MLLRPSPASLNCFTSAASGRSIPTGVKLFAIIPPQMPGLSHLECQKIYMCKWNFTTLTLMSKRLFPQGSPDYQNKIFFIIL